MSLAVIATFHRRWDKWPALLERVMVESTRPPDELYVVVEDGEDYAHLDCPDSRVIVHILPTPTRDDGKWTEIPYSRKINWALDRTDCDLIAYLTDDSLPHPDKYEVMASVLESHIEYGAVFCQQDYDLGIRGGSEPIEDAYCVLDHTQVMHRLTEDRWPTEIRDIRTGDAIFWRRLHERVGPFYPVPEVLDTVRQTSDGISATW